MGKLGGIGKMLGGVLGGGGGGGGGGGIGGLIGGILEKVQGGLASKGDEKAQKGAQAMDIVKNLLGSFLG